MENFLMRYGVTKEEYQKCLPQIRKNNKSMLCTFCGVISVFFFVMVCIEGRNDYTSLRFLMGIVALCMSFAVGFLGEKRPWIIRTALYLTLSLVFAVSGYQGSVLNTEMYCTSFLLVLAAFTVFLIDRPVLLFFLQMLASTIFLYVDWQLKAPRIAYGDSCNVLLALLWGTIAHFCLGQIRIRGMIDRAELYDAQKCFDVALQNSDLQIWEYDLINNRCINSKKANKVYGAPPVLENFPECLAEMGKADEKAMDIYMDMKRRLLAGETTVQADLRLADKDENWHWRRFVYQLEKDQSGKPIRAIGCSREITEQKELEQKYNDQLAYRNNIAKNSLFCMRVDLDDDRIFEHSCSEPRLEAYVTEKIGAAELMHLFAENITEQLDKANAHQYLNIEWLKQAYENGESQMHARYKCRLLRIYVKLEVSLLKNPGSGHVEAFLVFKDVNDICMTQKVLGAVVNTNYDCVGVVDIATKLFFCIVHSDQRGTPVQYFDDYDEATKHLAEQMKNQFLTEGDYHAASEDVALENVISHLKKERHYEFNVRIKGDEKGAGTYRLSYCYTDANESQILVVQSNVTKAVYDEERNQQLLADALHAAEAASRAKSEFLSRMSHEIRTPMNAIIGIATLAAENVNDPNQMREDLSKVIVSARYLSSLINDILDMSRIESGRMALNSAVMVLDEFVDSVNNIIYPQCEAKGIQYEVVMGDSLEEAYIGDYIKLQQILVNILGNSVKFTPTGGKITLQIEQTSQDAENATLRFTMRDTGIGIEESFLPKLFLPFEQESTGTTATYGGTGLGLAICKNIVEMMDGYIDVHSTKGVGTEFIVEVKLGFCEDAAQKVQLPLNAADSEEAENVMSENVTSEKQEYHLEGKHVLLVEDHPLNVEIAKRMLRAKGVTVSEARNGQEAIERFAQSPAGTFDAILMDVRMPVMDGLTAAAKIRKLQKEESQTIPIIAMTANAFEEDVKKSRESGMNAHLAKPIDPQLLYSTLSKLL